MSLDDTPPNQRVGSAAPTPGPDGAPATSSQPETPRDPLVPAIEAGTPGQAADIARALLDDADQQLGPGRRSLLRRLASSRPGDLNDVDLRGTWLLRRLDGSVVGPIRLGERGRVLAEPHRNEARWSVRHDRAVFTTPDGEVTTRFTVVAQTTDGPLLAGLFMDAHTVHVLTPAHCAYANVLTTPPETVTALTHERRLSELTTGDLPDVPTVILATPRTGSHLLINMLNSSHRVFFDPELMDYGQISVFGGTMPVKGVLGALRRADPIGFVSAMLTRSFHEDGRDLGGYRVRGFKIFPGQSEPVWEWAIEHPEFRVIYLRRENLLAEYSSLRHAWRTGRWVDVRSQRDDVRLDFDSSRFVNFVRQRERFHADMLDRLSRRRLGFIDLEYSQLLEPRVRDVIGDLLGEPFDGGLSNLGLQKQVAGATLSRFEQPHDVEQCLDRLGHPEWAESDSPTPDPVGESGDRSNGEETSA